MSGAVLLGQMTVGERVCAFLRDRWADKRHASEKLSRAANATPRAARNWLDGECAPRLDNIVDLMAADPELEALIIDIVRGKRAKNEAG